MEPVLEVLLAVFFPEAARETALALAAALESGRVLYLPQFPFSVAAAERRFLDPVWLSGTHKNISFEPERADTTAGLRGAQGAPADLQAVAAMLSRFRAAALAVVGELLPRYPSYLRIAPTSLRPARVEGRPLPWRKDDRLLHVDAFPSRPNGGERILRVFMNVNPDGQPRLWKLGEPFTQTAAEFLPRVRAPLPGSAALLRTLRITKSRRTRYDHIMLGLHDAAKRDAAYQARPTHTTFAFPAGAAWICFSDQVSHAALAGQHLIEQTLHLPIDGMYFPEQAPRRVLESLLHRSLN